MLTRPKQARPAADFQLRSVEVPGRYSKWLSKVVIVERPREVAAVTGFARIASPRDFAEEDVPSKVGAPLSRKPPAFVPAVDVRGEGIFVIESPAVGDSKVSFDPMVGLGADLGAAVWIWPEGQRDRDAKGRHGTLHAKCALADAEALLVSSANFTGDALGINMELGLLVEGGDAPATISEHFRELMRSKVLERIA